MTSVSLGYTTGGSCTPSNMPGEIRGLLRLPLQTALAAEMMGFPTIIIRLFFFFGVKDTFETICKMCKRSVDYIISLCRC